MVHIEGSVAGSVTDPDADTIYVIEPHANAVYADAKLAVRRPGDRDGRRTRTTPRRDRRAAPRVRRRRASRSVEIGGTRTRGACPGVFAGVLMGLFLYILARLLFRRRSVAVILGLIVAVDGMLFAQSRIGMNDFVRRPRDRRRVHDLRRRSGSGPATRGVTGSRSRSAMPIMGSSSASPWRRSGSRPMRSAGSASSSWSRSALGRLLLILGLVAADDRARLHRDLACRGQSGGNYLFLAIMVGADPRRPSLATSSIRSPGRGRRSASRSARPIGARRLVGPVRARPGDAGEGRSSSGRSPRRRSSSRAARASSAPRSSTRSSVVGRFGFGPLAVRPAPGRSAGAPRSARAGTRGWLRLGSGFGLPAVWLVVGLSSSRSACTSSRTSRGRWSRTTSCADRHGLAAGPHAARRCSTSRRHVPLPQQPERPHPASSPWWAWPFDLKPVWFYEQGFAGGTTRPRSTTPATSSPGGSASRRWRSSPGRPSGGGARPWR